VFVLKISYTKIAALTPLSRTNTNIRILNADQIPARDFDVLTSLPVLGWLTVSPFNQPEMEAVCNAKTVIQLSLLNAKIDSFAPLKNIDNLEELYLYGYYETLPDLRVLYQLESLRILSVNSDIYDTVREALPSASFEIIEN
jgi:hypothetical protein